MTISGIDMFPNETLIQALILEMPHRYSSLQILQNTKYNGDNSVLLSYNTYPIAHFVPA